MTRLTALTINNPDNDIRPSFARGASLFSAWVEIWESWHPIPRLLLSSAFVYPTAAEAEQAARRIIDELRAPDALDKILHTGAGA